MNATAKEVESRFGDFMEKAQHEPVTIEKTGQSYVVLLAFGEYERLRTLEDKLWGERALEAEKSGYVEIGDPSTLLEKA